MGFNSAFKGLSRKSGRTVIGTIFMRTFPSVTVVFELYCMQYITDSREKSPYWDSFSSSKQKFPHFIQPESSLSCSKQHETSPCPEADKFRPQHSTTSLFMIHFNINLLSRRRPSEQSLYFRVPPYVSHGCAHIFLLAWKKPNNI